MNTIPSPSDTSAAGPGGSSSNKNVATNNRFFIHFLMFLSSLLVSTSFPVAAAITRPLDPAVLTLIRFVTAAILFIPLVSFRHGLYCSWSLFLRTSCISLCLVTFFCCMFLALRFTSPLHTSIIFALVPSFSGLYAFLLAGERLSKAQLIALACGLIGVIWVIFRGDLGRFFSLEWNRGDAIFLGGCLAMGLYTPLIKLLHRGESMVVLTFWILVTGACWLFAYSVRMLGSIGWGNIPWQVWGGILYLAVFTTIVTFFLTQYAVLFLGPTRVAAYSYLYPGLVLLLDLALGHGLPSPAVLPGIGVVLVAMVVLQLAAGRDRDDT